ncbi:winged helix-turn-helix transcriptional regulator [Candidatus Bipolaricaulota bacterium]
MNHRNSTVPQVNDQTRELEILEKVASDPEVRQVDIATQLGVAVGTVNWVLRRLISKGYVKAKRIGRWQWRYLLTPKGMARKARLTREYVRYSMGVYREARNWAREQIQEAIRLGYDAVCVRANPDNELADVCRLSCFEQGIRVADDSTREVPILEVRGRVLAVTWPEDARGDLDEE